ncbi:G-protein coupled receptor GRL101-like [Ptychodera flava]|uniref:G-protein coupled receptor GRL101-like n=1 Tax=Ptychodera flava TaxID=63121 RepID=UPI00396A8530
MVRNHRKVKKCLPHADAFSSCKDLMANQVLRWFVWILGIAAFLGNLFVIVWRIKQKDLGKVHTLLIWNLAVADFLMAIYIFIIASVDMNYRGVYIRYDESWRSSQLCSFAGFLVTLSSEMSVFLLTVITLDRFLLIVFPLKYIRMHLKAAIIIVVVSWIVVAFLSFLPLIGIPYFGDNFYSRSPVCLSLHLTNEKTPGWIYSVVIFIFLNFLSFIAISIMYLAMYLSIRRTNLATGVQLQQRARETAAIAKRMSLIVLTDFFCWVPIAVMGMLAMTDTITIPGSVYAWTAVFILPINSAINPFLYTISVIKKREKPMRPTVTATVDTVVYAYEEMEKRGIIPDDLLVTL